MDKHLPVVPGLIFEKREKGRPGQKEEEKEEKHMKHCRGKNRKGALSISLFTKSS